MISEAGVGKRSARAPALGLWRMFASSRTALTVSVVTGLIAGGATAWLLTILTRAIEFKNQSSDAASAFFLLSVVALGSSVVSLSLLSRIAQDNLFNMRLWLSRRILAAPLDRLQILGAHRLMAALTSDVESVVVAQETLPSLLIEGAKVVAVFGYLYTLSPPLFLFVVAFVVVSIVTVQGPLSLAWRWLERARETENSLFNHFRAATEGGKELKLDARRRNSFLNEDMMGTARLLKTQRMKSLVVFVLIDRWAETLYCFLLGLIVFVAPRYLNLSSETLTGFALAVLFLGGPLALVGGWLPNISKGIVALRNIESIGLGLSPTDESLSETSPALSAASPGVLELIGVTHNYPGENGEAGYKIGPVSLRLEPGELVFLTGGNGSGKTSLAMLLLGLFSPASGEIRLGGEPVTNSNREAYRQNFSAVFADAYVFDSLLGYSGEETQTRAREMLALLRLDHKLSIDEGRFSTTELSRGQRKRLALLAAYVEDRPFYLFDEWAAEQDPQFRDLFYRRLLPDLRNRGKTVIVITHDDRYFQYGDRLLRMNLGQLDEHSAAAVCG